MRRQRAPEDIKDILGKVIEKIEKEEPGRKEKIVNVWKDIVGEKAALHSRPVGIKKRLLIIEVDSSTWLYELSLKKINILRGIKKALEEYKIEDIRLRMGDIT